jgi:hypothetical protein
LKSITEKNLETIEEVRELFKKEVGAHIEDEKKDFINWYLQRHDGPVNVLLYDLSNYYLHISENTIAKILNAKR